MDSNIKFWRLVFWDEYDYFEQEYVAAPEGDIHDIAFRFFSIVARDSWGISPVDNYFDYLKHTNVFTEEVSLSKYRASL